MNETSKTVAFIITASIFGVAAGATHWMTQPREVVGFEKVGKEFFPSFDDASAARSLKVAAYDSETDRIRDFSVEYKNGLWRIPSHHDYPAEAADRLARTATSLIGLNRESLVARRNSQHEKYGVIDPADPEATGETAGQRITLRNEDGDILSDYIIGKPAGGGADDNDTMVRDIVQDSEFYYVRVPGEKEVYKARVQIDLSTRFSDWIEPDLLKVTADDINRIEIDNYELVEQRVRTAEGVQPMVSKQTSGQQRLTREGVGPWQLEGLNNETEQLDELPVEQIITQLDSMKLVGVRPKLKIGGELLVKSDLSVNEALAQKNPALFQQAIYNLQSELEYMGFTIGAEETSPDKIALMASRGEVRAATNDGVLYTLYFGRSVAGDEKEIEIGGTRPVDGDAEGESGDPTTDKEGKDVSEAGSVSADNAIDADGELATAGEGKSRYVAIRVDFDPSALGEALTKPTEPAAPSKPEGYDDWSKERDEKARARSDAAEREVADDKSDNDAPDAPDDISRENDELFAKYEMELQAYEAAAIQYATNLESWERQQKDYADRESRGKEKVAQLNERFGEWYYVISAESLSKLKLGREDIVSPRETAPPNVNPPVSPGEMVLPPAPNIEFPAGADDEETSETKEESEDEKQDEKRDGGI